MGRWLFLHSDHLGSPRVVVDDQGNKISSHHYMPFGDEKPLAGRATSNNIKFTGHERDVESSAFDNPDGLDYMMARYYSSSLDRFLSVDVHTGKLEAPQSWNRYAYARNNPLKYVDPDGRDVEIAANARSAYTYAYTHSQNFRQQFNAANMNHDIKVKFTLGPVTGARGELRDIKFTGTHVADGKVIGFMYEATFVIPAQGDPSTGAVMGHELKHANNLARYGDVKREAPGEVGEHEARSVENSIRQDYVDDCDDLCRGSADEALRGTDGAGAGHSKPSEFEELNQYVAAADAEKKRLEKEGRW